MEDSFVKLISDDDMVCVSREDWREALRFTFGDVTAPQSWLTRLHIAIGYRRVYVNLFRLDNGRLAPSVSYTTVDEAQKHQNATSFVQMITVMVPREE